MSHVSAIIDALRQRGYRITPQREMIISILSRSETHMAAEEIYAELNRRALSSNITTVYRTLELLREEGFASRNDLGEGRIVYAPAMHGPHIHLVCRLCSQVIDADHHLVDDLAQRLSVAYQFQADVQHLTLFGVCANCQKRLTPKS